MSRWGRGRGGSVAVPLDSALFRENSNCPSAARSAGTVGKWGITSFTSIRSAPYAYANNILKKPVQDQNSPLTVPAVETEQPPPKPKKFFKSRNAEPFPPVPQISYAPPVTATPLSPEHPSHSKEKKANKRSRVYNRDSSSPELPRRNSEKSRAKKSTVATKASRKEEVPAENTQPPNKRYLVRNRDKVINYAEDGSNSPIPEFTRYESTQHKVASPKVLSPKVQSPKVPSPKVPSPKASPLLSSPSNAKAPEKIEVTSPSTSKDASEERKPPPIVLRISKGTSRIVSTDSNEGFTSPGSDRHSSLDTHSDIGSDHKKSPCMETICSPKHEGLKITIKCAGLTQESKKEKKKDKKEHKSHKRHHKNSDDEPLKKPNSSPVPGSEEYDLYRTLASPARETVKGYKSKVPPADDIESQLAKLDTVGSVIKSPRLEVQPNELPPEPKPPESSGRSRRNRPNINYSENDDYLDAITAGYANKYATKTVSDIKKEGRKTRKKHDTAATEAGSSITSPEPEQGIEKIEIQQNKPNINYSENDDYLDAITAGYANKHATKTVSDIKKEGRKTRKKHDTAATEAGSSITSPEPEQGIEKNEIQQKRPNINYSENDDYLDAITAGYANKHATKTVSDIKKEGRKTRKKHETAATEAGSSITSPEPEQGIEKIEIQQNKPNINYSENDDYLDAIDAGYANKHATKTVSNIKKEGRKTRKKHDTAATEAVSSITSPEPEQGIEKNEIALVKNDLIEILSGNESGKSEPVKIKLHRKYKHKHNKNLSPEPNFSEPVPQEKAVEPTTANENMSMEDETNEVAQELINEPPNFAQANTQSSDSAYNSCPNENFEEETPKNSQDDVFKSPRGVCDAEDHMQSEEKPSVKLVITKKKGSIFKSKSLVNDNPSPLPARKRRHLYRHEWANDKGNETPRPEPAENAESNTQVGEVSEELTRVTRFRPPDPIVDDPESMEAVRPYTSVRCAKEAKEYYTVVRNVKKAHQIQEIGEFQEFNDDVEYLLDALQNNNPISTRCLSAITLASKCTAPAFRMHLRAHGTVQKFFSALHDATNDQSLGLCTATVMFVLSQDRLNMDLDRESLELMLNLLESDASHKNALDDCGLTSAQLTKTQERVRELCAEIKSQGKAQHLDLENITVGHLAMETLLSLTSKRAGEWFKEELRVLGGVDHIVKTIQDCAGRLDSSVESWTTTDVEVLRKADRCLRVLENVTQQNEDNQMYLCDSGGKAACTICGVLRAWCGAARHHASLRAPLLDAALPALKVLLNLSHSFSNTTSLGAQVIGEQPAVMETCLVILNNQGNFIPDDRNFEFSVCVLLLLINLVQNNETNTQKLLNVRIRIDNEDDIISRSISALDLIVDLFYKREDLARRAEENTDALLDGKPEENEKKSQDDIDETVAKLLARAGAHMEHSMVGAYMALLLGHLGTQHAAAVRTRVPSYKPLLPTLKKYYAFLALTASAESAIVAHVKATHRIIEFMEASDAEQPDDLPQDMSLNNLAHNYSNYSNTSSDRSMELDNYH